MNECDAGLTHAPGQAGAQAARPPPRRRDAPESWRGRRTGRPPRPRHRHPGTDFNVVAATDSSGVVWLAWQSWREDNFDVMLIAQADGHPWQEPRVLSKSKANDWNPAIAADSAKYTA